MSVVLCTLALNEMEWLPSLYEQHNRWPTMDRWVFVESADRVYAETNPDMVSPEGLSVDGTSQFLKELAAKDERVVYIPHGFCSDENPAQGKCQARNRYLDVAEEVKPTFLFVLDGDEFYTTDDQLEVIRNMSAFKKADAFRFRQRHIWKPPGATHGQFTFEAIGGFWAIPHVRGWRWYPGLRYKTNHNTPELPDGRKLDSALHHFNEPQCVHMGFASSLKSRAAKHRYYAARGEGKVDQRGWYVESREAWETGKPLPRRGRVIPYSGPVPEIFRKKPVQDQNFWLNRLLWAHATGRGLHTAIYDTSPETWEEIQRKTTASLAKIIQRGSLILDAGCGYGALREALPEGMKLGYVGVDSSTHLLQVARQKYPDSEFVLADLRDLPFYSQQFDWVVCRSIRQMLLDETDDWPTVEKELKRVGKKVLLLEYEGEPEILR